MKQRVVTVMILIGLGFVSEKCRKLKKESMTSQVTLPKISKIRESGDTKIINVITACPICFKPGSFIKFCL